MLRSGEFTLRAGTYLLRGADDYVEEDSVEEDEAGVSTQSFAHELVPTAVTPWSNINITRILTTLFVYPSEEITSSTAPVSVLTASGRGPVAFRFVRSNPFLRYVCRALLQGKELAKLAAVDLSATFETTKKWCHQVGVLAANMPPTAEEEFRGMGDITDRDNQKRILEALLFVGVPTLDSPNPLSSEVDVFVSSLLLRLRVCFVFADKLRRLRMALMPLAGWLDMTSQEDFEEACGEPFKWQWTCASRSLKSAEHLLKEASAMARMQIRASGRQIDMVMAKFVMGAAQHNVTTSMQREMNRTCTLMCDLAQLPVFDAPPPPPPSSANSPVLTVVETSVVVSPSSRLKRERSSDAITIDIDTDRKSILSEERAELPVPQFIHADKLVLEGLRAICATPSQKKSPPIYMCVCGVELADGKMASDVCSRCAKDLSPEYPAVPPHTPPAVERKLDFDEVA